MSFDRLKKPVGKQKNLKKKKKSNPCKSSFSRESEFDTDDPIYEDFQLNNCGTDIKSSKNITGLQNNNMQQLAQFPAFS